MFFYVCIVSQVFSLKTLRGQLKGCRNIQGFARIYEQFFNIVLGFENWPISVK